MGLKLVAWPGEIELALGVMALALNQRTYRNERAHHNPLMDTRLTQELPRITALCEHYGVEHMEVFGSATGPDFDPETSDFDFLVELNPQAPGSRLRRWIELAEALEALLDSRVDLVNPSYLRNPYFIEAVNRSRIAIYDRQSAKAAA